MALLDDIKVALRIAHDKLDSKITSDILTARAEMVRAGIDEDKAEKLDDVLINSAITAYVCAQNCAIEYYDKYLNSWDYQLDNLRKSDGYRKE